MILAWTAVVPSTRQRRLRAGALLAGAGCVLLLAGAWAFGDPRAPLWSAGATALAAALLAWAARTPAVAALELAIDDAGVPLVRAAGTAEPMPAASLFAAPWLITLRAGAIWIPVWPDSVPSEAFRRLSACVRWARPEAVPENQQR